MSVAQVESAPLPERQERTSFFRQSGWLMVTTVGGGVLMYAVHFFAKVIPEKEYALYGALLAAAMCVPIMPLQMLLAQQAAAAVAQGRERQLGSLFRHFWFAVTLIWVVCAVVALFFQQELIARWGITNPAALWVTLLVILAQAWLPMFQGLLQGLQNFFTLGWANVANGVGRLGVGAVIVLVFGGWAAGIMTGALIGLATGIALCVWHSRKVWMAPAEPYDRREFVKQAVPLLAGFGACQFLMAADTMCVTAYLKQNAECYVAAGTLSRALVWAVGPITSVMFPHIVASTVKSRKSNLFGLTLVCTAVLALLGALSLWVLGPFIVRVIAKPSFVAVTTQILPWYAAAMIPLCVANVLVSNLMGSSQFGVVLPIVILAAAYGVTLTFVHGSFVQVLQLLGLFNLALLAICGWYTFDHSRGRKAAGDAGARP